MTEYVYVLNLEHGRYYVGKSKDPTARFHIHKSGKGAIFTAIHKPIGMTIVGPRNALFDEDNVVKSLMREHGIDMVRGGTYSQPYLPRTTIDVLRREILHADNKCYHCEQLGHVAARCATSVRCSRCNRDSHTVDQCYAKTHVNGAPLSPTASIVCYRCGTRGHYSYDCSTRLSGRYSFG